MADTKISALPSAGTLDGTEPVAVVQGGVTKQTTTQEIADLADTPTLQQVLDAGAISTTQMAISDGTDTIAVKEDVIVMTNGLGGEATISSPILTDATEFRIPNKAAGTETFAMLSDIGSSDSWASTEVTGNLTAANNTQYINTASATYTDPSPTQAKGYLVYVRNGTATIGGIGYSAAGTIIWRVYHSGAWATYVIQDKAANDAAYLKLTGGSLSGALNEAKGTDIASATTTDIGAATGNYVVITGTTTITGLGTVQAGTRREVNFSGILTLTHNGTSLILPTGANITTAAGDTATFISLGSGNWVCVNYQRASGEALVGAASNTFTIQCAFTTITTVNDGTSYHFGILQGVSASGTANRRDFKFTQAGTLKIVSLSLDQATNGSNETVNIYLRNVTTATDYSIGTFTSDFGANTTLKTRFTGLSIAVNTSDNWVVKILTPPWGTNPSSWTGAVILDIQV